MRKGDNGDGVSHTGDAATSDDALAAALESHFAPFAAGRQSVPIPVPHDDPRADAEIGDDDEDPEVTAITRKFDRTGDTLGAMDELEQLLIQRTGQIPVVTPELLAAHAARLERARPAVEVKADDEAEPDASREVAASEQPEPVAELVVEPEPEPEPVGAPAPESAGEASGIDWSIPPVAPLDRAPGFSPWIDPEATAAAVDTTPAPEYTDVSTKVFAVFSADRVASEPEPVPEPEPAPESEPVAPPAPQPEAPPTPTQSIDDELDGIDDLADASGTVSAAPPPVPMAEPEPLPEATPVPVPVHAAAPQPEPEPAAPPPPDEPPRKRRFWPFGRR